MDFWLQLEMELKNYQKNLNPKKDDYNSIMIKSIGDRIAEALAEMIHQKVRKHIGATIKMKIFLTKIL